MMYIKLMKVTREGGLYHDSSCISPLPHVFLLSSASCCFALIEYALQFAIMHRAAGVFLSIV